MAKLDRLIGTWTGTAEMVFPKMEPQGPDQGPILYKGEGTYEWAHGGMFLKSEGWHEMGPDERANMVEYWTWDPKAKKYRTWLSGDWGEYGEGTATLSADGNTFSLKGKMRDALGRTARVEGTMTFIDDNTIEWTWRERGPMGRMEFKGSETRKR